MALVAGTMTPNFCRALATRKPVKK